MRQIQIATLKNHLSQHLAAVRQGAEIVVLDRDTPVARLVPYGPAASPRSSRQADDWSAARLAELARHGAIRPGDRAGVGRWQQGRRPTPLPAGSPSAVDLLIRERRESTR